MLKQMEINPSRTYATKENAVKAVEKKIPVNCDPNLRYFIHTDETGRFFPVFVGEVAIQNGVHFHFNVIA
jgi:hypothetical protein